MAPTKIYLMMALGMALQLVNGAQPPLNNKAVCTSPQCVLTAASILRDIDPQVDPCEDFSAYTCGGFFAREEIPADQESIGYFRILRDENNRVIRSIVDTDSAKAFKITSESDVALRNLQKLRNLYSSCMDEDQIAKAGRQPVVDEVHKLLDVFPVAGSALAPSDDIDPNSPGTLDSKALSTMLAYMNKIGLDSINSFGVSTDVKNPKRHVLELIEGGLGLPSKEYYLDERIMGIYETTVGKMFHVIMGEDEKDVSAPAMDLPAKWAAIAKEVSEFEKKLAAASTDVRDLSDSKKTYNPRTMVEISAMTPSIDWPTVLANTLPSDIDIPHMFIITSPSFQNKLEMLLQQTPPQTFQYYLVWTLIRQLSGNLAQLYHQPLRELNAALSGVSADVTPDRSKHCVAIINYQLGDMAGQYFIEESFKGESPEKVHDMIETLRAAYMKAFPELGWLDKETAEGAAKKMKAIVQLIGFSTDSPNVGSSESLESYYGKYKVDPKDYFGNQLRVGPWSTERSFRELNKPVNMLKMHMAPQTVNAYYSPTQNQIVFPAGILQPPFFHTENPEYINYGGIGVVAGHEITHGFDNQGHLFDAEGRMANWWTNATSKAFDSKARCFVEQYGSFTVKGSDGKDYHVNGELTLGENIADNGGLKQSFDAWQERYKSDQSGKR
ncbi:hypothetical protein BGZ58_010890 [Dissophora ornata]|nr:hypothetical protein BGZ58_010890 [Dissophora ornata]